MRKNNIRKRIISFALAAVLVLSNSSLTAVASTNAVELDYTANEAEELTPALSLEDQYQQDNIIQQEEEPSEETEEGSLLDEETSEEDTAVDEPVVSKEAEPVSEESSEITEGTTPSDANTSVSEDDQAAESQAVSTEEKAEETSEDKTSIEQEDTRTPEEILHDARSAYFSDVQPYEDPADAEVKLDFSTMRLVVCASKEEQIIDKENILSSYQGVYLLQYLTEEQARAAYTYYSVNADLVSPDMKMEAASNDDQTDTLTVVPEQGSENSIPVQENENTNENPDLTITAPDNMTSDVNPISELSSQIEEDQKEKEEEASSPEQTDVVDETEEEHPLIALIDSGVTDGANIVNRVSMLGDDPSDDNGHGDMMAGYILEEDPDARILSIKALDEHGKGTISSVYAAMEYAISAEAKIINLSLYAFSTEENSVLKDIIKRATDMGIIVVGAAGNDGKDVKWYTPGNIEEAIIAGSCDEEGKLIDVTNYGDTVDYYIISGSTSEAAARLSGIMSRGLGVLEDAGEISNVFRVTADDEQQGKEEVKPEDGEIDPETESGDFKAAYTNHIEAAVGGNVFDGDSTYSNNNRPLAFSYGTMSVQQNTTYNLAIASMANKCELPTGFQWFTTYYHVGSGWTPNATSGWYDEDRRFVKNSAAIKNTTTGTSLVRIYANSKTFTITYNLAGGTNASGNPTSFTSETGATIKPPTRTGYTFKGWTGTNLSSATTGNITIPSLKAPTQSYVSSDYPNGNKANAAVVLDRMNTWGVNQGKNRTYTATWEGNPYTIKFNGNGSTSGSMNNLSMKYGTAKNLTANAFKKTGYHFLGWSTSSTATTAKYTDKESVNNLTTTNNGTVNLYAVWAVNKLTINYYANGATVDNSGRVDPIPANGLLGTYKYNYDGTNFANGGLPNFNQANSYWSLEKPDYVPSVNWLVGSGTSTTKINSDTKYATIQAAATAMGVNLGTGERTVNLYAEFLPTRWVYTTHWLGGLKSGEGNNGTTKNAFRLDSDRPNSTDALQSSCGYTGDDPTYLAHKTGSRTSNKWKQGETSDLEIREDYSMTPPNGTYLRAGAGTNAWTGSWHREAFGSVKEMPAENVTLQYDYIPYDYTITYNPGDGATVPENPTSYTVLYGIESFNNPTREGYEFLGWYDQNDIKVTSVNPGADAQFTNGEDVYTKLASRRTGNITLTAKWKKIFEGTFVDAETLSLTELKETVKNRGKFKIVEIKSSGGFIKDSTPQEIDINLTSYETDVDGNIVLTFNNIPNEFVIRKVGEGGEVVPNATFKIWHVDDSGAKDKEFSAATNDNGEIHVRRAIPGYWYYQETEAPAGYQKNSSVGRVYVKSDSTITGMTVPASPGLDQYATAYMLKVINPNAGTFIIQKQSSSGESMQGVVFTTSVPGYATVTTNSEGQAILSGLTAGTYTFQEISLPASYVGYTMDTTTYSFTVDAAGKISMLIDGENVVTSGHTVINDKNRIIVKKVDENGNLLPGAVIAIGQTGSMTNYTLDNGIVEIEGLAPGTWYYQEITSPAGYVKDSAVHELCTVGSNGLIDGVTEKTVQIVNNPITFTLQKNDDNNQPLAGAVIRITSNDGSYNQTMTTNTNGQVTITKPKQGTYTFKEVTPPDGYLLDENAKGTFVVNADGTVNITYDQGTAIKNGKNRVRIIKKDTTGAAVQGVQFRLSGTGLGVSRTETLTQNYNTGTDGSFTITGLRRGSYTISEQNVPDGYIKTSSVIKFSVDENGMIISDPANDAFSDISETRENGGSTVFTVTNHKKGKLNLVLLKTDEEDSSTVIEGAEFKLYKKTGPESETLIGTFTDAGDGEYTYSNIEIDQTNTDTYIIRETNQPAGYIRSYEEEFTVSPVTDDTITRTFAATNKKNKLHFHKMDGSNSDSDMPNVKYRLENSTTGEKQTLTTGEDGTFDVEMLAPGSYRLFEAEAPEDYKLDETVFEFSVDATGVMHLPNDTTDYDSLSFEAKNYMLEPEPHSVRIKKTNADGDILPGAEFELQVWDKTANKYVADSDAVFTLLENYNDENGDPVEVENAGYYVLSEQLYYTDDNLGKFKIVETKAPDGYRCNWEKTFEILEHDTEFIHTFTAVNEPNELKLVKKDAGGNTLVNVQFAMTAEYTDSNTPNNPEDYPDDGDLQDPDEEDFEFGENVPEEQIFTTNSSGEIEWTALKPGVYKIREVEAPAGYILNNTVYTYTVKDNGKIVPGEGSAAVALEGDYSVEFTCVNQLNKVIVHKVNGQGTSLAGAVYQIADGSTTKTGTSNSAGNIEFTGLTPGSWIISEVSAPTGYLVSSDEISVTVSDSSLISVPSQNINDVAEATVEVTDVAEPTNDPGSVRIEKLGVDNTPLTGATFGIYEYNASTGQYEGIQTISGYYNPSDDPQAEQNFDDDGEGSGSVSNDPIPVYTTSPKWMLTEQGNGIYTYNGLLASESNLGRFLIKEETAPDGYFAGWEQEIDLNTKLDWNLTRAGDGPVRNELASVNILKIDQNTQAPLSGAQFRVWNDRDGESRAITVTSNAEGLATISRLHANTTYHIRETKAPNGYQISGGEVTFETDQTGGYNGSNNVTVYALENAKGDKKLIINVDINKRIDAFEDISFIYDIHGVKDTGEEVNFSMILTPKEDLTDRGFILHLDAGTYDVTQRKPSRYRLESIDDISNTSTLTADTQRYDLTEEDEAEAFFHNVIEDYGMFTSADAKVNHIGEEIETTFTVTKTWNDGGNEASRPASVAIEIYNTADPDKVITTVTLTKNNRIDANTWSKQVKALEKYDGSGNEITYAFREKSGS